MSETVHLVCNILGFCSLNGISNENGEKIKFITETELCHQQIAVVDSSELFLTLLKYMFSSSPRFFYVEKYQR